MKFKPGILFLLISLSGCGTFQSLTQLKTSPRDLYLTNLKKSELSKSAMVRAFSIAGDPLHHDSVRVKVPYQETGFFPSSDPQARFYRFDAQAGQIVTASAMLKSKEHVRMFIDLFTERNGQWKIVAYADTSNVLAHELDHDEHCLVRIQPELLTNVFYSVSISAAASLIIPVKGATNKSIGSFYNDNRTIDGKIRKHEGVDIFAPKGTYVIAPADGVVSRVGTNTLGGKVMWMLDEKRNHSYYFAHLDSQIAKPGTRVKQGDVLGTVGNTGNAKNTPAHLHFGVYQQTSKDPIAYLKNMEGTVKHLSPDTLFQSVVFRVKQKKTDLQTGPSKKLPVLESIVKDSYLKVIAKSDNWFRVITADNREGFVQSSAVVPANKGNKFSLKKEVSLLSEARRDAVPQRNLSGVVEGLASYKAFSFVRTQQGDTGWIDLSSVN